MGWRILVNFIRQPMLKLKTHSGLVSLAEMRPLQLLLICLNMILFFLFYIFKQNN